MIPRYIVDFAPAELDTVQTDMIIIGAGIAGLFTALQAAKDRRVLMITKKSLFDSNTRYAQGGIAAVISEDDSPEFHRQDTLIAGAGLCDPQAVDVLVHEGPDCVQALIQYGTHFDEEDGHLALTKEGAHSQRRILHANGDATGYEIVRALAEKVQSVPNIEVWDDHFVLDLLTEEGECVGALVQKPDGSRVIVRGRPPYSAPAVPGSCTATRRIRRWRRATASRWLTVQARSFATWSSISSTRLLFAIPARRAF